MPPSRQVMRRGEGWDVVGDLTGGCWRMDDCIDAQYLKTFSDLRIHILTSFVFYYGKL